MSELLPNFLEGRWQTGSGKGTALFDPVTGEELVRVDATGHDLAAAFAFARDTGGAALRAMTYPQRAAMLGAIAKHLGANKEAYYDISTRNSGTVKNDTLVAVAGLTMMGTPDSSAWSKMWWTRASCLRARFPSSAAALRA